MLTGLKISFVAFLGLAFVIVEGAEPPSTPSPRDALNAKLAEQRTLQEKRASDKGKEGETISAPQPPLSLPSIQDRVAYLQDSHSAVLIPSRALLHLPPKSPLTVSPKTRLKVLDWTSFLNANRARLHLVALKPEQVTSSAPLPTEMAAGILKTGFLAITTLNGQPIGLPESKTSNLRTALKNTP